MFLIGIVQRILRGVNARLRKTVVMNWKPGNFFLSNFKGTPSQEEHKTIFSGLKIKKMALSGSSYALAFFSTVHFTLCDTYIDFPQSVNSGKSIRPSYGAKATADCRIPVLTKFR
jgi:hypothetical protein